MLMASAMACNALWGVDDLSHAGGGVAGAGGSGGQPATVCERLGETRACYTGLPESRGTGECADGLSTCVRAPII